MQCKRIYAREIRAEILLLTDRVSQKIKAKMAYLVALRTLGREQTLYVVATDLQRDLLIYVDIFS
jgi:hypothetical protein